MTVSHVDHDKAIERSFREVCMRYSVQILRLILPFYIYHEIYFYVLYIPKEKKTSKFCYLRNITFMVYIIIKI